MTRSKQDSVPSIWSACLAMNWSMGAMTLQSRHAAQVPDCQSCLGRWRQRRRGERPYVGVAPPEPDGPRVPGRHARGQPLRRASSPDVNPVTWLRPSGRARTSRRTAFERHRLRPVPRTALGESAPVSASRLLSSWRLAPRSRLRRRGVAARRKAGCSGVSASPTSLTSSSPPPLSPTKTACPSRRTSSPRW